MSKEERLQWGRMAVTDLGQLVQHRHQAWLCNDVTVTILAGERYVAAIAAAVDRRFKISTPLAHLGIGQQLQWLKQNVAGGLEVHCGR